MYNVHEYSVSIILIYVVLILFVAFDVSHQQVMIESREDTIVGAGTREGAI